MLRPCRGSQLACWTLCGSRLSSKPHWPHNIPLIHSLHVLPGEVFCYSFPFLIVSLMTHWHSIAPGQGQPRLSRGFAGPPLFPLSLYAAPHSRLVILKAVRRAPPVSAPLPPHPGVSVLHLFLFLSFPVFPDFRCFLLVFIFRCLLFECLLITPHS